MPPTPLIPCLSALDAEESGPVTLADQRDVGGQQATGKSGVRSVDVHATGRSDRVPIVVWIIAVQSDGYVGKAMILTSCALFIAVDNFVSQLHAQRVASIYLLSVSDKPMDLVPGFRGDKSHPFRLYSPILPLGKAHRTQVPTSSRLLSPAAGL